MADKKRGRPRKNPEVQEPEVDSAPGASIEVPGLQDAITEQAVKAAEEKAAAAEAKLAQATAALESLGAQAEEARVARLGLDQAPKGRVTVRDAIAQREEARLREIQKLADAAKEGYQKLDVGIWRNEGAIKRLKLRERLAKDPDIALIRDEVPWPGCTTNGVVFRPGSVQLLPEDMWRDIQGRCGVRENQERLMLYGRPPVSLPERNLSGQAKHSQGLLPKK